MRNRSGVAVEGHVVNALFTFLAIKSAQFLACEIQGAEIKNLLDQSTDLMLELMLLDLLLKLIPCRKAVEDLCQLYIVVDPR